MKIEIGVILGALTGLTPIIMGQIEKRGKQARRTNTLGLVQRRVEYLNAWIKTQELVCSAEEYEHIKCEAATELRRTQNNFMDVFPHEQEAVHPHHGKGLTERLFLMYSPKTMIARVWQVFFYVMLGLSLFSAWFAVSDNTGNITRADALEGLTNPLTYIFFGIMMFITIVFRNLFVRAEKMKFAEATLPLQTATNAH